MTDLVIKNPDGSYATTDATNLKGNNWHKTIRASDGTIPEEDIKKYYWHLGFPHLAGWVMAVARLVNCC